MAELLTPSQRDYPYDGKIVITTKNIKKLALRIPGWCTHYTVEVDGMSVQPEETNGYIQISLAEKSQVVLDLKMEPVILEAAPAVIADSGKVAVMCGPIVYCAEGVDNGENLHDIAIDPQIRFKGPLTPIWGQLFYRLPVTQESGMKRTLHCIVL